MYVCYICVYTYTCVYIYIYIYIYTCVCVYIYICIGPPPVDALQHDAWPRHACEELHVAVLIV